MAPDRIVVKIGGSLFELPDLGMRLRCWLRTLDAESVWIVPGGGETANVIRRMDQIHQLGEATSHWLALRALALNVHILQCLLSDAEIINGSADDLQHRKLALVNAHAFALMDESRPGKLPHDWNTTSDAIAARIAIVSKARKLVLLKSVSIPPDMDWQTASETGHVDAVFPQVLQQARGELEVEVINFREILG